MVRPRTSSNGAHITRRPLSPALFAVVLDIFEPEVEVEPEADFDLELTPAEEVEVRFAIARLESDKGWSQRKNG